MIKNRNLTLIVLALVGGIALAAVEFGIKTQFHHAQQKYQAAQLNPLNNDFQNILRFKNRYMGNSVNDSALNLNLPLGNLPRTYALDSQSRQLDIRFMQSPGIGADTLESSLVYDATANFALINNLESMDFVFPGHTYHVTRARVKSWYGVNPTFLAADSSWHTYVQGKLSDAKYVSRAFKALFENRKFK